jgi:flagellar biogenesis protein FliO
MKSLPLFDEQGPRESPLRALWMRLRAALGSVSIQRRPRRLHLCETLSLGEKRLLAVVEYEDQRFLLAATAEHISLLQALGTSDAKPASPEGRA